MRVETRHGLVLMVGTVLTAGLSLAYVVYVGRELSSAAFGEFMALLSLISLGFAAMGPVHETVTRFAAEYHGLGDTGRIRGLAALFVKRLFWVAAAMLVIGFLSSGWIRHAWRMSSATPVMTAWLVLALTLFLSTGRGILRGVHRFSTLSFNQVAEAALRLIIGTGVLSLWVGPPSVVEALMVYPIGVVAAIALCGWQLSSIWRGQAALPVDHASILLFLGPVFGFALLRAGHEQIDMLFVKYALTPEEAGLYGAALSITRVISVAATPFGTLLLPMATAAKARNESISSSFLRIVMLFLAVVLIPVLICVLLPRPLLTLLYGASPLVEAAPYLGWLMLGRTAVCLTILMGVMLISVGHYRFLYIYGLGLVIQVGAILLAPRTLMNVVWVVVAAQGVSLAMLAIYTGLRLRTSPNGSLSPTVPPDPSDPYLPPA